MRTKIFREKFRTRTKIFRRLVFATFRENRATQLHLLQGETRRRAGGKDNGAPGTHRLTLPSRAQSRPTRDDEPEAIPLVATMMIMMMTMMMMLMMESGAIDRLALGF